MLLSDLIVRLPSLVREGLQHGRCGLELSSKSAGKPWLSDERSLRFYQSEFVCISSYWSKSKIRVFVLETLAEDVSTESEPDDCLVEEIVQVAIGLSEENIARVDIDFLNDLVREVEEK